MCCPRFHPQHDTVNLCHGVNRFFLSIFSIMIVRMLPIVNSKPSEAQHCAAATQLTRLLILETTLYVWLLLKKHTNWYLFHTLDVT